MNSSLLRSALFVPASRPERIPKALASGADGVIVDLEDAVEPDAKPEARENIARFAQAHPNASICVRVNAATSPWFADDILLCGRLQAVTTVMLPKTETAGQIREAAAAGKPIIALIESARGVVNLAQISLAAGTSRLCMGNLDLALDLDVAATTQQESGLLDQVRGQIVLHSRAAGLPAPLDGVYPDIRDTEGLDQAVRHARSLGFAGALCIHPAQIAVIHRALAPTPEQVRWAERLLAAAAQSRDGAFSLDGKMIDAPVIEQARKLLQHMP